MTTPGAGRVSGGLRPQWPKHLIHREVFRPSMEMDIASIPFLMGKGWMRHLPDELKQSPTSAAFTMKGETMPDYPRCKTCKWWGDSTGGSPHGPQYDPNLLDEQSRYRPCGHPLWSWAKEYPHGDHNGVAYPDVDEPPVCGPNFGCVHHNSREGDDA